MARWATGTVVAIVILLVGTRALEGAHPILAWARAFLEAALIGALADWFAVVALFRHPLGLPFWHTAVIPRNKDRFAAALANFIVREFLHRDVLQRRLRGLDFAGAVAQWLAHNRESLARTAGEIVPQFLGTLGDAGMKRAVEDLTRHQFAALELSPLAADLLQILGADDRLENATSRLLREVRQLVTDNRDFFRGELRRGVRRSARLLGVGRILSGLRDRFAEQLADRVIGRVMHVLESAAEDPRHCLRDVLRQQFQRVIATLHTSPDLRKGSETLREQLLTDPLADRHLDGVWDGIKRWILADLERSPSTLRAALASGIADLANHLAQDTELADRLDAWLAETVLTFVEEHRDEMRAAIEETVRSWDGREVADKLEREVWNDLQFIRLNGTIVGGALGLVIHALSLVF